MTKKAGKMDMKAMRKLVNKTTGMNVAHDLTTDSPTVVKQWIPTGSRWLDSIIKRGQLAGVPVGKITEIAGLSSSGKSFMAVQLAANAAKMGMTVVYFDAESAIDPDFLQKAGCDLDKTLYSQAVSVEKVLQNIEALMAEYPEEQFLFIWDSIAATPSEKDLEGDFNPQSSMAVKPRIFAKAFPKLCIPLANQQSTLVLINQLKTNISSSPAEMMTTPFIAPGGKAIEYFCSLRIWLTKRKARASFETDDKGFRVGSEVKVKLQKSRFGSEGRECTFKILWGGDVGIRDEESWLTALRMSSSPRFKSGAWNTLTTKEGKQFKFQASTWLQKLKDPEFKQAVFDIMDEEIIMKYDNEGTTVTVDES